MPLDAGSALKKRISDFQLVWQTRRNLPWLFATYSASEIALLFHGLLILKILAKTRQNLSKKRTALTFWILDVQRCRKCTPGSWSWWACTSNWWWRFEPEWHACNRSVLEIALIIAMTNKKDEPFPGTMQSAVKASPPSRLQESYGECICHPMLISKEKQL